MPRCFVFDQHRKLKYKGRVDGTWRAPEAVTEDTLRDALAALVQGEEPPCHEAIAIECNIKGK